jgi:hypothetical protein
VLSKIAHARRTERNYLFATFIGHKYGIVLLLGLVRTPDGFEFECFSRHLTFLLEIQMEQWYSLVRRMRDESEAPRDTEVFAHRVFHDISRKTIKEKVKFRKREGREFLEWVESMEKDYSPEFMNEILGDDDFWELTLKLGRAA